MLDILRGDPHLLSTNGIESPYLVFVEHSPCLFTDEALCGLEKLIVLCVYLLCCGLLGRNHSGIEAESDLSLRGQAKETLALSTLSELFLSDSFHKLCDTRLSALDAKHL